MSTQHSPDATAVLKKSLLEAVHTLKQLTSQGKLPKAVIAEAKGLVFLSSFKAALGFSAGGGTGVAIAKLESGSWSAPLPLTLNTVGFGAVVGYEEQQTLVALAAETDFHVLKEEGRQGSRLGVDWGVTAGSSQSGVGTKDVEQTLLPNAAKVFALSKGVLADVSLSDTSVTVDKQETHKVYGFNTNAANVLDGKVAPPSEAQELYAALQAVLDAPAA